MHVLLTTCEVIMKKTHLIALLIVLCFLIMPEAFASTMTSNSNGLWTTNSTWNALPLNGQTYRQPSSAIDTIIIQAGDTVTLNSTVSYNGTVVVEGVLIFEQDGSQRGRLNMDASSKIFIKSGAEITSEGSGNGNNAGTNNWISIGGVSINGWQIRDNLGSPDYIDYNTIGGGGGCVRMGTCTPIVLLPIELLYFRSKLQNNGIYLEWASAKEWNFSHYTLERSDNGKDYSIINVIYGNGVSNTVKRYNFQDEQPNFGANYYRLTATDVDGTETVKSMVLAYAGMEGALHIFPNPARGEMLTLRYPGANEGAWLSIQTINGREIMTIQMLEKELRLPVSALPKGIYIVKVNNQFEVKQLKLVIP